jgi:HlyD family secretion protein
MANTDFAPHAASLDIARYSRISLAAIAVLVVGLGGWVSFTSVAGAVISSGTLVVESNAKQVQHPEGGTVAEILAHNEDRVTAGQVLVRLDDTTLRASLAVVANQLDEAHAIEARLTAEIARDLELTVPVTLADRADQPAVASLLSSQRALMHARRSVRSGNVDQLTQQVTQLESQIAGSTARQVALRAQLEVISRQFENLSSLLDQQLVGADRVGDASREKSRLIGEIAGLEASAAQTRAAVVERKVMIGQIDSTFLSDALAELQVTREKIAQLKQQEIAADERLSRSTIVAPQAGVVHQSIVNTVGGVIGAGETLMQIVPIDDPLLVEVRLNPLDVDKVKVGQAVEVKLPGLDPRKTPDVPGLVSKIAPDLSVDAATGQRYFSARIALREDVLETFTGDKRLISGMPADAYIQTGDRTVLAYLLQPLTEQIDRAMRED